MDNWNEIISENSKQVLNYVYKLLGNLEDAHDITQETFIACYKNIDTIDETNLLPWLYKTAHNKALNYLKKNRRYVTNTIPDIIDPHQIEINLQQEKRKKYIQDCFKKLKPKYALILDLQLYQKKTYKEIAELTGISISALESILVRAKKQCRKILQEYRNQGVI